MSESPTKPPPEELRKARMSSAQMLHLMRLEMDQALRHDYPISCMMIGLDGFTSDDEAGHRRTIMPAVFGELKKVTFENDVRGLGIWAEQYQLAIFPHVTPQKIAELAADLLERARALENPLEESAKPLSLSIGVSHNLHQGERSFASLVEEAEAGMGMAISAGGDRYILARDVESELDRLQEEVQAQIDEIRAHQDKFLGEEDDREADWGRKLVAKILAAFEREPEQSAGVLRLEREVIALVSAELEAWRESSSVSQLLESQRQIDMLERRVRKLTDSLGVTEKELQRIASMKNVDGGVASIYRTVQGLSDGEDSEQKGEMLKNIFEANLALRDQMNTLKAS